MEDFLKADGLSRIIFYFQEVDNIPDAGTLLTCLSHVYVSSVNNNQFFLFGFCMLLKFNYV